VDFLVFKKHFDESKRFATLLREALVFLPADLVFDDLRKLLLQHGLDRLLLFFLFERGIDLNETLKIQGLRLRCVLQRFLPLATVEMNKQMGALTGNASSLKRVLMRATSRWQLSNSKRVAGSVSRWKSITL